MVYIYFSLIECSFSVQLITVICSNAKSFAEFFSVINEVRALIFAAINFLEVS